MGSNYCKYCGCPENYYTSKEHSQRPSCAISKHNHHEFVFYIRYKLYTFMNSCNKCNCK